MNNTIQIIQLALTKGQIGQLRAIQRAVFADNIRAKMFDNLPIHFLARFHQPAAHFIGGNDVNAVDDRGETAMHGAAYKQFPAVAQFLADQGAKIEIWNRKNSNGWTPLRITEGDDKDAFEVAIEATASAQDEWVEHVGAIVNGTIRASESCNSWYIGANVPGKPRVYMSYVGGQPLYRQRKVTASSSDSS